MNTKTLKALFKNKSNDEKYDLILNRIVKSNKIWFLDNAEELVCYKDSENKSFVPIWSDKNLALLNPPKHSKIQAVDMDVETFLLQFTVFLFNSRTGLAVSPMPNDREMIAQNALAFTRDLIETIRVKESEEKALHYLNELKKIIKM